jgi:multidrug resistance efflux pump
MPLLSENQLQNLSLVYLKHNKIKTQIIYSSTVFFLLFIIGVLPLVSTTIYLKVNGIFHTSEERITLIAPINGYISNINLQDNQKVTKGMVLLTLDQTLVNKEEQLLIQKEIELNNWLSDIKEILQNWEKPNLKTPLYQTRNLQFKQLIENNRLSVAQAKKNYDRYAILLQKKVISNAEFEIYDSQYNQTISHLESAIASNKVQLQMDAKSYLIELNNLRMLSYNAAVQRKNYELKATVNGFIQNVVGISVGNMVFANQKLGEISPNGDLFAYCYVNPKDIGMIKKNQQVTFQIDAFNYNQWGSAVGTVFDIAQDVILINGFPFFKVKCILKNQFLQLKNGVKGHIKKGMSFTASFQVTNRTLWQLLTDRTINWLTVPNNTPVPSINHTP